MALVKLRHWMVCSSSPRVFLRQSRGAAVYQVVVVAPSAGENIVPAAVTSDVSVQSQGTTLHS